MNIKLIEQGIGLVIEGLGCTDDCDFDNFHLTPSRVAKAYQELFSPPETGWPVFDEKHTDKVILKGHTFYTLCPHHLLPVKIVANVGYMPNGKVIGASKLARMIHEINRKPMTQEALTSAIIDSVQRLTAGTSRGEAVMLSGEHDCMRMRGIRSDGVIITDKYTGVFEDAEQQRRFVEIVRV